jgi:hypothetical protein
MNPGFWHSNFYPTDFWHENFWQDFGGLSTAAVHIFSTAAIEPAHVSDSGNNVLIAGDLELQNIYVEDTAIFTNGGISYNTIQDELQISCSTAIDISCNEEITLDAAGVIVETGYFQTDQGRIKNTSRYTSTQAIPVTDDQVFCNGTFTVTLPVGVDGQAFRIINAGTGTITITSAENIVGSTQDVILNAGDIIILTFETTDKWW